MTNYFLGQHKNWINFDLIACRFLFRKGLWVVVNVVFEIKYLNYWLCDRKCMFTQVILTALVHVALACFEIKVSSHHVTNKMFDLFVILQMSLKVYLKLLMSVTLIGSYNTLHKRVSKVFKLYSLFINNRFFITNGTVWICRTSSSPFLLPYSDFASV